MNQRRIIPLLRQFKRLRCLYLGYLSAAVLALILYFVDKRGTLVVLGISLAYHLIVVRPRANAYQKEYVHACVQLTLERYLDGAVHTSAPVLAPEALRAARLIADNASKGAVLCCEGGYGEYKGRAVQLGDVTFSHSFPMDGKTHHEFVTGMWITVELGHDTGLDWRVLHKRVMMAPSRSKFLQENPDLQLQLNTGPAWLEEYMVVQRQGTPPLTAEGFLPLARKLAESTSGALALCVQGSRLHVFVTNRIFGQKVSIREAPEERRVSIDLLPELEHVLKLADRLS